MQYSHELIMPNKDLPFKMFLFEGKDGNYFRDKHWHRSIEIFAVLDGGLVFISETVLIRSPAVNLFLSIPTRSTPSIRQNRTAPLYFKYR